MDLLNATVRVTPETLLVFGTLEVSGGSPSLTQLSGFAESDQAQVSVADNGTGDFTISVTNFRGPQSYLIGLATGTTISNMVSCTAQTYTADTDTANFTFKVEDDGSTAADNGFNFILVAF
jgi:hypothetical protein